MSAATKGRRTEYMLLGRIVGAERNPKLHHPDLARSIERFGLADAPVLDERTGRLVAGHGRLEALRAAEARGDQPPEGVRASTKGWLVPVQRGWASRSDADAAALLVAHNRIGEAGGWDDAALEELLREVGGELDLVDLPLALPDDLLAGVMESLGDAPAPAEAAPVEERAGDAEHEPGDEDGPDPGDQSEGARLMRLLRPAGLQAPFPWFGGKRRVAGIVWAALGAPRLYVEPFAGSLATLLARPAEAWPACIAHEHVNDLDDYLVNFWRATAQDPDGVAGFCDWPVTEADLHARHKWLVTEGRARLAAVYDDPEACDAQVAGWWCWGLSAWIGSGWCSGQGVHAKRPGPDRGVHAQRPHINGGQGVHAQRPHLGNALGVHAKRPHLGPDRGVHAQRPHLASDRGEALCARFAALRDRLRGVEVIRGSWERVLTEGALNVGEGGPIGVFLDPPYDTELRAEGCYAVGDGAGEQAGLSAEVRAWAVAHGADPRLRIVLAGYAAEHEAHVPREWRRVAWASKGAYQARASVGTTRGGSNRDQERLWLSPGCLPLPEAP